MSASLSSEEAVFEAVMKRPSVERNSYLKRACGDDQEMRRRIEERVAAREGCANGAEAQESMDDTEATVHVEPDTRKHARIDRYKLLNEIGCGGFGCVWQAEQAGPIPRRVALKVVKLGKDTRDIIAQFEVERQLLALMDHPCIAKVFDAGATPEGLPYFVMELVSGVPITRFCREQRLSTAERLRLFIDVCKALQHAHQKGVSHRDIKPSNILVGKSDGKPLPKVIDFGIARATRVVPNGVQATPPPEHLVGTPAYMSPEQAAGSIDIDTRCDVYALGVLLYELLTNRMPFDLKKPGTSGRETEIRRIIREVTPLRPSEMLARMPEEEASTIAALQQTTPRVLLSDLREDLDWIVMKAMQKDRNLRYETANGLAMDVERFLMRETVVARPTSNGYRLRKLVSRNRLVYTAGTLVAVALMVGIGISVRQTWRVTQMEREQQRLRALAELGEQQTRTEKEAARRSLALAQIALADAAYRDQDGNAMLAALRQVPEEQRDSNWRYLMEKADTSIASLAVTGGAPVERVLPLPTQPGTFILVSADHWVSVSTLGASSPQPRFQLAFEDRSTPDFSLSVSSDGTQLAAAKINSGGIIIHDLKDGAVIARWESPGIDELHFSPDGKRLLEITHNGPSRMRLVATGEVLWTAADAEAFLHAVFDSSGRQLICNKTTGGQRLQIINALSGDVLRELDPPRTRLTALCLSPDGRQILTGDQRGFVRSMELKSGNIRYEFRANDRAVSSLAFLQDGRRFVTLSDLSGGRQSIQIWDNATGIFLQPLLNAGSAGRELCVHPLSGEILATGASAKAWRISTLGEKLRLPAREFANTCFWGGDESLFAHGTPAGIILIDSRASDAAAHPLWQSEDKNARSVASSADGKIAAVASTSKSSSSIQLLRRDADHIVETHRFTAPGGLAFMQLNATGSRLLVRAVNVFYVLDTTTQKSVSLPWDKKFIVRDATWSGEGTQIIALLTARADRGLPGSEDRLALYDAATGDSLLTTPNTSVINAVAASPDGRLCADAGADRMVRLRDARTLEVTRQLRVHDSPVMALAFHPTRPVLATASDDLTIKLWSLPDGVLLQELSGLVGPPRQITFSLGGSRIACLSGDRSLRVWDLDKSLPTRPSE